MIIPAIDLFNGNIVRLYQGNYKKQSNYGEDPFIYLNNYFQYGIKRIHIVDLNGAINPLKKQTNLIKNILNNIKSTNISVQVGGGIRNTKDIKDILAFGADRVVIGSMIIQNPEKVKKWLNYFGNNSLVLAIDIKIENNINQIFINGWQKKSQKTLEQVINQFYSTGLKHILCTDISKDGTLLGSNYKLYSYLCKKWPNILFQASGGISNLNDIIKLKHTGISDIIIGRALLEKKITLLEVLKCYQNA